jgi:hypothetical protein
MKSSIESELKAAKWWYDGWWRAHAKHIYPSRTISHDRFMKIVKRESKACIRMERTESSLLMHGLSQL